MADNSETFVGISRVECPQCRFSNPPGAMTCQQCQTPLQMGSPTTTGGVVSGWSIPMSELAGQPLMAQLTPGSKLGGRYEIIQMLGEGGMGAVYKARDVELDRLVALKVIRPELAGRPEILQRFKQELILARQITHKNVIRIFDLGQADGIKFITMEYVEGRDLKVLLREKRKFSPEQAVAVVIQVARALDAAHAEGVVHRDLKPQNIMLDEKGRVRVMDFGIARTLEMSGMTQTGALVGTPEYMSPEQAKGEKVDTRSDLFPLGIIFYELLTGKNPYESGTAMGTLLKRIQEPARQAIELDPAIPQALSDIVAKCLERDLAQRYQQAKEFVHDLELWRGGPVGSGTSFAGTSLAPTLAPVVRPGLAARYWQWATAGLAVLLLAVLAGTFVFREKTVPTTPGKQKVVTLLVADFNNATGDAVFDGTLEPMFTLAMEGASFITSVPRNQALRVASQIQIGATKIDEALARLVAVREGINVVVAGSIGREGNGYVVAAKAIDAVTGKQMSAEVTKASDKEKVLATVGKLAAPIRKALGDATPESAQIEAAETFTAGSVEAAHHYAVGQQLHYAGRFDDAIRSFEQAVQLDPNLGRAYAALSVDYFNLGRPELATKQFEMAMARIDRMTEREKARTRGTYYLLARTPAKAAEEYAALVKQYPADTAGHAMLAVAYSNLRNLPRALEEARQAVEIYPTNVPHRNNMALIAMYAGDFDTAIREARAVLDLNASYGKAYMAVALSALAKGQVAQAAETYGRLEKVSVWGASYAASGLADIALYEGRLADAVAILDKASTTDLANNNPAAAANKFVAQAYAQLLRGQKSAALVAVDRALSWSKEEGLQLLAARALLMAGQDAKARALAANLGKQLAAEPQAYAKLIEGEAQLNRGNAREAIKTFQEAQKLLDHWLAHFNLGRAYLEGGAFTEAHSEFDVCVKRRGEATTVFFDEVPTYWVFPAVYYYLGRAQEGIKSPGAVESYRTFLAIKEKGEGDPLVADARRRVPSR